MEIIFNKETIDLAIQSILENKKHNVIRIDGSIGAGKTTLISELCKKLGVDETTSSPTFSFVNSYQSNSCPIYHFDFYRLEDPSDFVFTTP